MVVQLKTTATVWILLAAAIGISACATSRPIEPSDGHIYAEPVGAGEVLDSAAGSPAVIPEPVTTSPYLPAPAPRVREETYTVVVSKVPVSELLFALARDARINIDIIGDMDGLITLNAIDQTLIKILDRIALQAPIRYEVGEDYLIISADQPYFEYYTIDYLNMSRRSSSRIDLATQVGSISLDFNGGGSGGGSNNSQTVVENISENLFWDSLTDNIRSILDVSGSGNTENTANRVIVNRESGLISVRASRRQQREVHGFINRIMSSARRQALIEATVVEVTLSNSYQAGIDWRVLTNDTAGFDIIQSFTGGGSASATTTAPNFLLSYTDPASGIGNISATLKLLDQFGDVQILSSPKIIAMNNQTAVLKVVDNRVYFTISVDPELRNAAGDVTKSATVETQIHTVPVGFVMNVTPYISSTNEIILNVRPTISRILGFVNDPNPELAKAGVVNRIPEIQVREMESMLRVSSGQVAIIGGLMQDQITRKTSGVPGLSGLPVVGGAFSYQDDLVVKTELLVFLRPTVIDNASLDGELEIFKKYLPVSRQLDRRRQTSSEDG